MSGFLVILLSTVLANNIILQHMVGADPALALQRKLQLAADMSLTLLVLLPLLNLTCYLLDVFLLLPLQLDYLRLLLFIMAILIVSLSLKYAVRLMFPRLSSRVDDLLPFAVINTTVLGMVMLGREETTGFIHALAFGLGTAAGFSLVLLLLTATNERMEGADVPAPFRGLPVQLITLAIVSLAFQGFAGIF